MIFFVLLWFGEATSRAKTEYFNTFAFWESPIQIVQPQTPITQAQAQHRVHVRVDYDEQGRVREFSYRLGEQVKDLEGFAGNLYVHAPITRIRYTDNREFHSFFDRFGNPIQGWGVWQKIYQKDEFGRFTQMTFEDQSGQPVDNAWGISRYEWQYLEDGRIIETRTDADGKMFTHRPRFPFKRIRLSFDKHQHLSLMENLDGAGNLLATETGAAAYRYHYHPDGRFLRWEVLDTEGKPAIGPTNTSGEDNHYADLNFTAITFFDQKGQKTLHASGAAAWQFESDTYGNIIRVSFQGLDGTLTPNRSGIFQRSYSYSTAGKYLVAITNEDQSGQPINSSDGYAIEEIERGSKGLVMRRTYRNAQGACVARTSNGIAYITYTYDANDKCIAQMGYDTNNKQVSEDRYP